MQILTYAIRPATVLKHFGALSFVVGCMTLVPLLVSLACGDSVAGLRYGVVIAGIFAVSTGLKRLPASEVLQTNEAMVITAMIFLMAPLTMAWPMMSAGLTYTDAFFEAVSAVTTTGLSTTSVIGKTNTFLFSRAWMQWLGGLGIVVLSLAIMIRPGLAAKRLGENEDFEQDLVFNTRQYARLVFVVYASLTLAGFLCMVLTGAAWFESVLYVFAAISTGGFSPLAGSLNGLESRYAQMVVILISFSGGISLILYSGPFYKNQRNFRDDLQTRGYILVCLFIVLLLSGTLHFKGGLDWDNALWHGMINGISAQSTAGFSSVDLTTTDNGSKIILIFSMLIGGGIGSTAGGIKIFRLLIIFCVLRLLVQKAGTPRNAVTEARIMGRRITTEEIQNAISIIFLFSIFIALSWLVFVLMGYNPLNSLFEVISALGTVGLSAGITGPSLDKTLKLVLCADMLLGRLEILAWVVMLTPGTWLGQRLEK